VSRGGRVDQIGQARGRRAVEGPGSRGTGTSSRCSAANDLVPFPEGLSEAVLRTAPFPRVLASLGHLLRDQRRRKRGASAAISSWCGGAILTYGGSNREEGVRRIFAGGASPQAVTQPDFPRTAALARPVEAVALPVAVVTVWAGKWWTPGRKEVGKAATTLMALAQW